MELLESSGTAQPVKSVNLKREIGRYLKKWPWFLLSMAIFFSAAKIYLRYAQPQYFTKTSLKLQESKGKNTTALSDLKNLGVGVSGNDELQGETTVVVSKPILGMVGKNLNLQVSFFSIGAVKEVALYNGGPLKGKIISVTHPERFSGATYTLTPEGKNGYRFSNSDTIYQFGSAVKLPFGIVQIDRLAGSSFSAPLKVVFKSMSTVISSLENSIAVSLPPNKGMLMELSIVGAIPQQSEDILNELSKQYIIDGIKDKNEEAQNTQNFINDRLAIITDDLSGIEGQKENFKRTNQITNLEVQAGNAVTKADENTKIILTQTMQLDLVNSVLAASSGDQLLPSGLGLSSGAESNIVAYNDLLLTRNRVLKQATGENPAVITINKQITELKNLIRKNLIESRETLQLQLGQAKAELNLAKGDISKFPEREKIFRSIDRQQTLKEQLYLYLLQKREENAITLAVTAPKAKVINPAYTTGIVSPNRDQIEYGSLAIGLLLPLLFFFGKKTLDTKIHTKNNILSHFPTASVIAEVPFNKEESKTVHSNDFSVYTESFRILSSNLKYLLRARGLKNGGVVLVTSSVKGEGKTTVSVNTALTLAGKSKVIIVGADIRNPQLHRFMDGHKKGLTDYLVSDDTTPDLFIMKSNVSENLDVLFGGQMAPNPNDLLDMEKFDLLIAYLKTKYEYVVLDSAPVMLVSDTLHLVESADVVLYVAKADFTEQEMIGFAESFRKDNNISNMAFILNGVKPENTRYGTKYSYGYYSYTHDEKPKWWKKFV
ncbi:polysaccharide biosynthesis tyrosine autokinase [Kaistella flava (ex Peng et al. 2021)]|uniref:Polysaccharide biosynthesis tyrosine autokinase n=1 Tax=Kaistella flava (ex Peng et al. 2021) TaxID=2038776 RepID=A0A7M2Y983_9FLAO|nr:tyrosine-protein kinase [Kaistella flava (ex Peng et al. 2021)]QOW10640.1 polysaccharide biosynthesis tyrosine autokinase [Kaistella flava (ex Peng et al. 2021)]